VCPYIEVADLAVASPATVSRCGMVYLEPHQLGWRPLFTSWLSTLDPSLGPVTRTRITGLFDWLLPPALRTAWGSSRTRTRSTLNPLLPHLFLLSFRG